MISLYKGDQNMEELVEMSNQELERYRILSEIKNKRLSQKKGAELLGLSTRQIRNLLCEIKKKGAKGLVSKKRGKPSNRRYCSTFKDRVLSLIQHYYEDFGPTFISEKLEEKHHIGVADETLRNWMSEAHLWIPKQRRANRHPLRKRRECFGELIQVDGSHHDWFEGRGSCCVLIVFIDDATSRITSLYFAESESLDAYFNALEMHLNTYGRPREIYSDRLAVFQTQKDKEHLTQFKYALKLLGISHTTAKSPQAKGRVERANQTLQDRLIKEMRLKNISTIEGANQFGKEYMQKHNNKFSKEPASTFDAHRPLETDLSRILCRYEERTLTNDLSISFHNKIYQIYEEKGNRLPKKAKIEVRKQRDGKLRFFFQDQELRFSCYDEIPYEMNVKMQEWKAQRIWQSCKPSHPWKNQSYWHRVKEKELRSAV